MLQTRDELVVLSFTINMAFMSAFQRAEILNM